MIDPGIDVEGKTFEEVTAAYMAQGLSRAEAEVYAAALLGSGPRFPVD